MSAKQKIVHGSGLSNLNLGIFVYSFDVCRHSKPFPSINYDQPYFLQALCDFFNVTESMNKGCETGPSVYSLLSEKNLKYHHLQV